MSDDKKFNDDTPTDPDWKPVTEEQAPAPAKITEELPPKPTPLREELPSNPATIKENDSKSE